MNGIWNISKTVNYGDFGSIGLDKDIFFKKLKEIRTLLKKNVIFTCPLKTELQYYY